LIAAGRATVVQYRKVAHFWQSFLPLFSLFASVQILWLRLAALRSLRFFAAKGLRKNYFRLFSKRMSEKSGAEA
jgi:hypothetical protein